MKYTDTTPEQRHALLLEAIIQLDETTVSELLAAGVDLNKTLAQIQKESSEASKTIPVGELNPLCLAINQYKSTDYFIQRQDAVPHSKKPCDFLKFNTDLFSSADLEKNTKVYAIVKMLIEYGANANVMFRGIARTPLLVMVLRFPTRLYWSPLECKHLVFKASDPEIAGRYDEHLNLAKNIVSLLLQYSSKDYNVMGYEEYLPLENSFSNGNPWLIEQLLANGFKTIRQEPYYDPFIMLIAQNEIDLIKKLLDSGVHLPKALNDHQKYLASVSFVMAAQQGDLRAVKQYLLHNGDPMVFDGVALVRAVDAISPGTDYEKIAEAILDACPATNLSRKIKTEDLNSLIARAKEKNAPELAERLKEFNFDYSDEQVSPFENMNYVALKLSHLSSSRSRDLLEFVSKLPVQPTSLPSYYTDLPTSISMKSLLRKMERYNYKIRCLESINTSIATSLVSCKHPAVVMRLGPYKVCIEQQLDVLKNNRVVLENNLNQRKSELNQYCRSVVPPVVLGDLDFKHILENGLYYKTFTEELEAYVRAKLVSVYAEKPNLPHAYLNEMASIIVSNYKKRFWLLNKASGSQGTLAPQLCEKITIDFLKEDFMFRPERSISWYYSAADEILNERYKEINQDHQMPRPILFAHNPERNVAETSTSVVDLDVEEENNNTIRLTK